jgi:WD40 repeat protein
MSVKTYIATCWRWHAVADAILAILATLSMQQVRCRAVNSLAFSQDGMTLAAITFGCNVRAQHQHKSPFSFWPTVHNTVELFRLDSDSEGTTVFHESERRAAELLGESGCQTFLAFSSDRKTLAFALFDGTIALWDLEAKRRRATIGTGHSMNRVSRIAFSPDGKTLAVSGRLTSPSDNITLWDLASPQPRRIESPQFASEGRHSPMPIAFSPDGGLPAQGGDTPRSNPVVLRAVDGSPTQAIGMRDRGRPHYTHECDCSPGA